MYKLFMLLFFLPSFAGSDFFTTSNETNNELTSFDEMDLTLEPAECFDWSESDVLPSDFECEAHGYTGLNGTELQMDGDSGFCGNSISWRFYIRRKRANGKEVKNLDQWFWNTPSAYIIKQIRTDSQWYRVWIYVKYSNGYIEQVKYRQYTKGYDY